jgi:hypothetical protein
MLTLSHAFLIGGEEVFNDLSTAVWHCRCGGACEHRWWWRIFPSQPPQDLWLNRAATLGLSFPKTQSAFVGNYLGGVKLWHSIVAKHVLNFAE